MLSNYESCPRTWKQNFINIPVNRLPINDEGVAEWNRIITYINSLNLPKIIRTPSHGICTIGAYNKYDCYDISGNMHVYELTLLTFKGCYRIQLRNDPIKTKNGKELNGPYALKYFKKLCEKHGINLDGYRVNNGVEIKNAWKDEEEKIYKRLVYPLSYDLKDKEIENVHHIDLCSGFQSGLMRAFPEFEKPCRELYSKRHEDESIKAIQVYSIGEMWSTRNGAQLINLAKGAIEENNRLLDDIICRLLETGRQPILVNTDGIWYTGEVYHDKTENHDLGGWRNDYINCKLRFRSANSYEFIHNGKYNVRLSGKSTYETIVPRQNWVWGDIYKGAVISYKFDKETGLLSKVEEGV